MGRAAWRAIILGPELISTENAATWRHPLLLSLCYLVLRHVLQWLALQVRSDDFKDLEILPSEHACRRFLHGRDDLAAVSVRALLYRTRESPSASGGLHGAADGRVGHA